MWKNGRFFKISEITNFYVDIWSQHQKLSILMCGSTTLRQSTPNHDFFSHLTKVMPELENQHSIQIQCMAHYSALLQIRAYNSKLCNISKSNIMILFWYQLKNSRPTFLNMNFIKNHHESICFLKNRHFDPNFTLSLLLFASLPIEFYCGKKMMIFENFRNPNFHANIWIQLQKLSILMCVSTTSRQSTPNHDFFHITKLASEPENQHSIQFSAWHITAHYSKSSG